MQRQRGQGICDVGFPRVGKTLVGKYSRFCGSHISVQLEAFCYVACLPQLRKAWSSADFRKALRSKAGSVLSHDIKISVG